MPVPDHNVWVDRRAFFEFTLAMSRCKFQALPGARVVTNCTNLWTPVYFKANLKSVQNRQYGRNAK